MAERTYDALIRVTCRRWTRPRRAGRGAFVIGATGKPTNADFPRQPRLPPSTSTQRGGDLRPTSTGAGRSNARIAAEAALLSALAPDVDARDAPLRAS